ncbi:MAG: amidohydrolase family protein [Nitrospinota bacterium]|nr:amidohydrolase family protein [Nitrospinota bacterium]
MSKSLALVGCEVLTPTEKIRDSLVLIEDSSVVYIGPSSGVDLPVQVLSYDLADSILTPGFIDLQVNGFGQDTILSADPFAINRIAKNLFKTGTTSFLPTLTSCSIKTALSAAEAIKTAWSNQQKRACYEATILGVHMEGPFFNPKMCGAHPIKFLRKIDFSEIELIAKSCGGFGRFGNPGLKMVTFSPELDSALDLIKWLSVRDVIPAIGHTMASSERIRDCVNAGARFAVHVYNRYSSKEDKNPLHRTDDPMLEVADNSLLYTGIISDGVHVSPSVIKSFVKKKGWQKIVLTSDLVSEFGLFEKNPIKREVLSGSKLTLGEALPLFKSWSNLDNLSVIATLTRNPAKLLGLEEILGTIISGSDVNFCLLDKETLQFVTALKGESISIEQNKEMQTRLIL